MAIVTEATLTCPECGFEQQLEMPTDVWLFFYSCANCQVVLKPKSGDCCVFCSFADVPCPPKQREETNAQPL